MATIGYSITLEEGKKRFGTSSNLCHGVLQRFLATSNKCLRSRLVFNIHTSNIHFQIQFIVLHLFSLYPRLFLVKSAHGIKR